MRHHDRRGERRFGSTQVKDAMSGFYHGLLGRVNTQRGRRLFFTGEPVGAREALRAGQADEVVPYGQRRESALRLAQPTAKLTAVLKEVALRASNMDHIGATASESGVTHVLLARRRPLASAAARHLHGQVLSFDGTELSVWSHPSPPRPGTGRAAGLPP